jgi:protein-disulfide isomerase
MFKPFYLSVAATLLLAMAGSGQTEKKKSALDKPTLEAYVRHLYVMDSRINMQISDPKPSTQLPGFLEVSVHAWAGQQSQDFPFFISKDGSKILQGTVYDAANNPFKNELDKIKTESEPSLGTPGAPVVIVEFSDFQCPYCKEEAKMLRQNLLTAYPTQVRLYFKTFPLESLHPWAKPAAIASRCVYQQQPAAFWTFHDWIFEHQAEVKPENLKDKIMEWAKTEKQIDGPQLGQCMDQKGTEAQVNKNLEEGKALAVGGTPTLFVNGRRIPNTIDWPNLRNIIDFEINYQKTAKNAGEDCGCEVKLDLPGMPQDKTPPLALPRKK